MGNSAENGDQIGRTNIRGQTIRRNVWQNIGQQIWTFDGTFGGQFGAKSIMNWCSISAKIVVKVLMQNL